MYVVNGKGSAIRLAAGLLVLGSAILGSMVSRYWLIFTGFVGVMLMVSALTGFCPMELILRALGVRQMKVVGMGSRK